MEYILLVSGIAFLVKGAHYLVEGASSLAKKLGMSTLVIGLTIVAFGTSTPELLVNIFASINGSTGVAFGNIIGSNVANILLVLGVVAIIAPIKVKSSTIWKEIPFALLAVVVLFVASNQVFIDKINIEILTRVSGLLMLGFFGIFIYYALGMARTSRADLESQKKDIEKRDNYTILFLITIGLAGLYLGGKWTVDGAILLAENFGLSEFLISATIIAIGTSLPELATGFVAAKKGDIDLAVGNTVGSNIFNIFWILGITAIISPIAIPDHINTDIIILFFVTLFLFFTIFLQKDKTLSRKEGIMFLLLYVVYIIFLIYRG